jgi:hypothetical protein
MSTSVPAFPVRRFSASSPFANLKKKDEKPADDTDDLDDPDPDDDEDDEEVDEAGKKKPKKSKKTKKAEDDADVADQADATARATRERERRRCLTILNSNSGKRLHDVALHLALQTNLAGHAAVALMKNMRENVQSGGDTLRNRMAGTTQPDVGVGAAQSTATLAQQIILAGQRRRGEKV